MSEENAEDKTLKKLEAVKRKLAEEQYGATLEDALIYCVEHTYEDLVA